jgi:hypothetical protein
VGKLFSDTSFRGRLEILGSDESDASRAARRARSSRKHACVLAPEISEASPLSVRLSPSEKEAEHEAVVRVRRSACDSVTDRLELVGVLSLGFALPQYLCVHS